MKKPITKTAFYMMVVGAGGAAGLVHYPLIFMVLVLVVWGLITLTVIMVMQWRTRYPNCRTMLRAKGRTATKDSTTLAACPHCGVNFDQPVESVANTE